MTTKIQNAMLADDVFTTAHNYTVSSINGGPLAGLRNFIINGGMQVQQRANGTLSASEQHVVDRFISAATGSGISGTITSASDTNFTTGRCLHYQTASWTTGYAYTYHRIEAANAKLMYGKTVTVSAKVYHDYGSTTNFYIQARYANSSDNFGAMTTIAGSAAIPVASGAYTTINFTFAAGTNVGTGVQIGIYQDANTVASKNLKIGDWQLEIGSTATPFEQRHYGLELALCQRYYEKSYDDGVAPGTSTAQGADGYRAIDTSNNNTGFAKYKITKRVVPTTITIYSITGASGNMRNVSGAVDIAATVTDSGAGGFRIYSSTSQTAGNLIQYHWTASSEL